MKAVEKRVDASLGAVPPPKLWRIQKDSFISYARRHIAGSKRITGQDLVDGFLEMMRMMSSRAWYVWTTFAGRETYPQDPAHHTPEAGLRARKPKPEAKAGLFGHARISASAGVARSGLQNRGLQG
jgi:hypothetical protein